MKRIIFINLLFIISVQFSLAGDSIAKIDEILNYYFGNFQFNGTVLIARKSVPVYEKSFGYANLSWNIPNTPDTKFRIYSMSKAFTSMIIYQLVNENKIKLTDKLKKYLPELKTDTANLITIHNLLTHTSGIKDYLKVDGKTKEDLDRLSYSAREFIEKFIDKNLEFIPGKKANYSNSNHYILSVIIEKITDKSFEENINERIFIPLGMKNSGIETSKEILKNMSTGYFTSFGDYSTASYVNMDNVRGCGNVYTTARDLLKWDQALYTDKLLPDSLKKIMYTPLVGKMYASGWLMEKRVMKTKSDTLSLIRHSGGYWGYRANIIRVNNNEYTIIILSNINLNNSIFMNLSDNILNTLYEEPFKYPKIPISMYLYPIVKKEGVKKAVIEYNSVKGETNKYGFHFMELKTLGEYLAENKNYIDAIEIFKLNVNEYPENWVVHADLADIYIKLKDKINAIEYITKSLETNKQSNEFERQAYIEIQKRLKELNE